MSFNLTTPKPATGFTLPAATTTAPTLISGGTGDTKTQAQPKPATGLFGASATSPSSTGLLFGAQKTAAPTLTIASSTPAAAPQFGFGTSTAAATTSASFTPLFGATSTAASTASPASTAAAVSAPLKLTVTSAPTSTSAPSFGLGGLTGTSSTQASATITSTTAPAPSSLTYAQLEDSINKWTIDLEEQGKFFINQARQLNAWDSLLISNSEKMLHLNESIELVKQQQRQLDQELDFILAQQNELDELSAPLEKLLADIPVTDQSRFQTYQLSEIIDSQLKQMSEDLKEVVEHLNEGNKNEDISDPITQISRILNAHMNSLQWVDRNTAQISSNLEQISQLHETCKKNHLNL